MERLHAVAGCQVPVNEVLAAKILHSPCNVCHKFHQHLGRKILKKKEKKKERGKERKNTLDIREVYSSFIPLGGDRA